MEKREVTCDQCGKDLTWTGNCEDWRISLANEPIPSRGGFVTDMAVYPLLKSKAHFCGTTCLGKWVSETYPNAVADYDKYAARRLAREQILEKEHPNPSIRSNPDGE